MAKSKKTPVVRALSSLRRGAGPFWTEKAICTMRRTAKTARESSPEGWPCESSGESESKMGEAYEEHYALPGDPFLHMGAILAWNKGGFGVTFEADALDFLKDNEDLSASTESLLEVIWPCAMVDVSALGFSLYPETLDTIILYPTYLEETGERVVGVLGIDLKGAPGDAVLAKVILGGDTFADVARTTRIARERESGLAMVRGVGGLRRLEGYGPFDPYLDEPELASFAIRVLCAMTKIGFWEHYQTADIPHRRYRRIGSPEERRVCLENARNHRISSYEKEHMAKAQLLAEALAASQLEQDRLQEEANKKERRRLELARRQEEKAEARRIKAEKRAQKKAENIAEAERKAKAKAEREVRKKAQIAEKAELSAIAREIKRMEDEQALKDADPDVVRTDAKDVALEHAAAPLDEKIVKSEAATTPDERDLLADCGLAALEEDRNQTDPEEESKGAEVDSRQSNAWSAYEVRRLGRENRRLSAQVKALRQRATFAERMVIPTTAKEALTLALDAFPDRICATEQALASTEGYRGDVPEVWRVLQTMACILHPLVFGDQEGSLSDKFQAECGFELALRDVKQENKRTAKCGARKVLWKGQERDLTPHVKGKGVKRGQTLRVHFFADYEEEMIVIAHCGEHLESYVSSKI